MEGNPRPRGEPHYRGPTPFHGPPLAKTDICAYMGVREICVYVQGTFYTELKTSRGKYVPRGKGRKGPIFGLVTWTSSRLSGMDVFFPKSTTNSIVPLCVESAYGSYRYPLPAISGPFLGLVCPCHVCSGSFLGVVCPYPVCSSRSLLGVVCPYPGCSGSFLGFVCPYPV